MQREAIPIDVVVTEPEKFGDGMNSYITYKIRTSVCTAICEFLVSLPFFSFLFLFSPSFFSFSFFFLFTFFFSFFFFFSPPFFSFLFFLFFSYY
jgi:hypothetical protein